MLDNYYALRFIYLLTQPWTDTPAYKLGLIDASGNVLKARSTLKTDEEKKAFSLFHQLVWKIKVMLEKLPLGKTTIAKYATALLLLKEEFDTDLSPALTKYLNEQGIAIPEITQLFLESENDKYFYMFELAFVKRGDELVLLEMDTAGIEMSDKPLGKPDEQFAGHTVFTCDPHTYHKCRLGKTKFSRYKTYVGADEVGEQIRQYGRKYPKRSILLKNSMTGSMLYLRKA